MIEKRLLKKINFIKNYQIIGGIIGLLITTFLLVSVSLSKYQNLLGYFTITIPFIFFGLCIYSGYLLKVKNYTKGFNLVIFTLFLQIIAFEIGNFFYSAVNGIAIRLSLKFINDLIIRFDFYPSHFLVQFNSNTDDFIIKINIIAIIILFYVLNIFQEIKKTT